MITSIELGDFLSHSNTRLEFNSGVTVFVGSNGAGKSSIIDGITFGLFGQHTRKSNKGLIRNGASQGFVKINFSIRNKKFETIRKINNKGSLSVKLTEIVGEEIIEIAAGERKQYGESTTREIEKIIGLDFEKLKIASIVQQGELNSIINAKPKEFKEMLNAIIGIDKLDIASECMKNINKEFREKIKQDVGYDDTHIEILLRDLQKYENEMDEAIPKRKQLSEIQEELKKEIDIIRGKIEIDAPKIDKINQLDSRKNELSEYANNAIQKIQREINENERKIQDCKGCFEYIGLKEILESKIQKVEEAIEDTVRKNQEMLNQIIALKEKISLASKLQIKNNKCPVCDSNVEKLNPFFQEEHLRQEITELQKRIKAKEVENDMYNQKRKEFLKKMQISRDAEATLRAYSINNKEDLDKIQNDTKTKMQKIPLITNKSMIEMSKIDEHTKMIFNIITKLETETKGFDEQQINELKMSVNMKQTRLSHTDQQMGAILEKISKGEQQIVAIKKAISELKIVKEYVTDLNEIQTNIFSRDGPVATSLRSWALNTIAVKASEYLALLNTKIQRISLSEKTRDISITCHSKSEVLELESLSGGEKVSVALALRLGMASLLGASNLNLMILDEPTTHLDAERKKSLVSVLSQLSDISNSESRMQFLIITHDAEIFEDSTVEQIYKFESSAHGSKVIAM